MRVSILVIFVGLVGYMLYTNVINNDKGKISTGDIAPDFQLKTLDGKTIKLSDYKGQGVFLNFWATYCPPCKKEMPYIENQYQKFKNKGVTVLAVDVGEPKLTVDKFVQRYDLSFPILLDSREEVLDPYGIGPIPVTFLIDKNGKVVDRITAGLSEETIKQYMQKIKP